MNPIISALAGTAIYGGAPVARAFKSRETRYALRRHRSGARNSQKCWARNSSISTSWSMVLRPRARGGPTASDPPRLSTSRRDKWMRSKPNSEAGRGGGRPLVIDLVERGENCASEFGARASDAQRRKTTVSSSATPAMASITRGEGHWFKQRFNGSRASALHIRPRAQAAAIEDLAITIVQQIAQRRQDFGSRSHAIARGRAYGRVRMPQQPQREQVRKFHAEL